MRASHAVPLLLVVVTAALVTAAPAVSSISGPCKASIAGTDVAPLGSTSAGDAIKVGKNDVVPVTMSSTGAITHLKVVVSMAGFHFTAKDAPSSGTSWAQSVKVHDYAKWGVGLYQVTGESTSAAGTCSGTALVKVGGSPLATVAGWVGLVAAVLGGLGVLATGFGGFVHPGRSTFRGLGAGLMLGIGAGVLLQQFSLVYPTRGIAIATLASGAVAGVVLPHLLHLLKGGHFGFHRHSPGI